MVQLDAYDTGHAIQVDVAGKQRRLVPLGDSGDEAVDQSAGVIPACRRQVESRRDILPAIERLVKVLSLDRSPPPHPARDEPR